MLDAQPQIHRAVAFALPAMEQARAEPERARAGECGLGRDHAGIKRGKRHHHLEGRTGRIGARERLVDQRLVVVVGQIAPLLRGETDVECVGIKTRGRDEREHVAAFHVHDGTGGAVVLELPVDQALQLAVDRQVNIRSRRSLIALELANDAAIGIHFDAAGPGPAADCGLVCPFDAALADAKARHIVQRVVRVGRLGNGNLIVRRYRRDVAEHVRQFLRIRIISRVADFGLNARQVGEVEIEARKVLPAQIFRNHQRHEGAVGGGILQSLGPHARIDRNDAGQGIERGLDATARLLRHDQDAVVAAIAGKGDAEAVEDAAAQGRKQPLIDAIVLGLAAIELPVLDLELVEPAGEHAEDRGHSARQKKGAARERRVAAFRSLVDRTHVYRTMRTPPTARRCNHPKIIATGG